MILCVHGHDFIVQSVKVLSFVNSQVALQSAQDLDDKDTWYRLGLEALRQGNHQIVEFSYQKTKSLDRLAFLYLIMGNTERLAKMMKIAEMYNDVMGRFQSALFLGDVRDRVKVLEESGQIPLAYVAAKAHGLMEEAERLREGLTEEPEADLTDASLLLPPPPITRQGNWPLLTVSRGFFDGMVSKMDGKGKSRIAAEVAEGMDEIEAGGAWGDEGELDLGGEGSDNFEDAVEDVHGGDGEDGEDEGWDMEVWWMKATEPEVSCDSCITATVCMGISLVKFALVLIWLLWSVDNQYQNSIMVSRL